MREPLTKRWSPTRLLNERRQSLCAESITGVDAILADRLDLRDDYFVGIYLNGILQQEGWDIVISGVEITYLAGSGTAADMKADDCPYAVFVINEEETNGRR